MKKQKQGQDRYKIRKQEYRAFEKKEKKEKFRRDAIDRVNCHLERCKKSNSIDSGSPKWLFKCFDHYFDTYNGVDDETKKNILALVSSINQNFSKIEEKIESCAKRTKHLIEIADAEGLSPLEFQKVLSKCTTNEDFDGEEGIETAWKNFFKTFQATLNEILKQVINCSQNKMWYKSLTKIYSLYKKQSGPFSNGSLDYFCLKEKLCIVCNERSHHIDFDEELAKSHPTMYTYHGKSEFELSMNHDV